MSLSGSPQTFEIGLLLARQPLAVPLPTGGARAGPAPTLGYTLFFKPLDCPAGLRVAMQAAQFGERPRQRQTVTHAADFLRGVSEGDRCQVLIAQPGAGRRLARFRVADGEIADLHVEGALRVECARATAAFQSLYGLSCQLGRPLVNVYATARGIEAHSAGEETPPFGSVFTLRERRLILFTRGDCQAEREHLLTCLYYIPATLARYFWWDGQEVLGMSGRALEERLAASAPGGQGRCALQAKEEVGP
jgi:hypothetical protein